MLRAIGIDLGSTKSVVAALRRGEPEAILNRERSPLTPSLLALGPAGELLVGQAAGERLAEDPLLAVASWSSRLGQESPVSFNGLQYTPGELAAIFLARLREDAQAALGGPVRRAVLAAPVSFDQRQMADLRHAAHLAGLFVLRIVPSPTAAALAYSVAHPDAEPQTLLVYDLGGGCLDVAVYRLFHGALTTLGLAGENWLGGNDLTESIVAYLIRCLQGERRVLLDETQAARQELRQRLRLLGEQAKVALSTVERVTISLSAQTTGLPVAIDETLTRSQFEELIRPRLEEALAVAERALLAGGLAREGIDGVLMLGGSTRVPLLQALLAGRFRRAHSRRDLNPLLGVAMGAAVLTGMLTEVVCRTCHLPNPIEARLCRRCQVPLAEDDRLACRRCFMPNDVRRQACWKCGASLRAASRQPAGQPSPARLCRRCGALAGPGRAVCSACHAPLAEVPLGGLRCCRCGLVLPAGAASCAACGELVVPFVGNVTGRSLGTEMDDGRLDVVLPRGLSIPSPQPVYRDLRTAGAGQQHLEITLYEGDRPLASENPTCGHLHLTLPEGLPPESVVRVGFALNRDGMLEVSARLGDGSDREVEARLERE